MTWSWELSSPYDSSSKFWCKQQSIDHLKSSSLSIDPELSQLEARRAKLEKELENMKAAIDRHKSNAIQQKK